jgi:glycerol-3-phosphate dehydrogenase
MIGTTDVALDSIPSKLCISDDETEYLIENYNNFFKLNIKKHDVIHSWSGIRPLIDTDDNKASNVSRDFKIELITDTNKELPLINIFGGKLTAHRLVAQHCIDKLDEFFVDLPTSWTSDSILIGGFKDNFENLFTKLKLQYNWLPIKIFQRLFESYGLEINTILYNCCCKDDLGVCFGHGLYEKEVIYLLKNEWAQTAEDILWRRTKLGLHFSSKETKELQKFLNQQK